MINALEVTNLKKSYGDFSLDIPKLSLPSGCIMGFIGENGAGKTTTVKLLLDLIRPDGGDIRLLGETIKDGGKKLREQIGVVMDESCFPENISLRDADKIMKSSYKTWDSGRFKELAEKFSLPEKKRVKEYSRGMKMKLSIAVALSHDSRLLILDEATSGLDPIVRDEILDVFLDFIQDEGHSIFVSSHIISDLEKVCDYIVFLHEGKLVFCEEKDALLDKYVVVKCSAGEYDALEKSKVIGARKSSFGVQALMERAYAPRGLMADMASVEDIMLYFVKEAK